jgi:hypothetical protein
MCFLCDCDAASITLAAACAVSKLKEYKENYKVPDEKPKIDKKDWLKTFESINDFLAHINGEQNLPLAYVIRCNTTVPPNKDDLATNYLTAMAQMIAQAPHGTATTLNPIYTAKSVKVAEKMSKIVCDTVAWTYVKKHVCSHDGLGHIMPCLTIILVLIMCTIRHYNWTRYL